MLPELFIFGLLCSTACSLPDVVTDSVSNSTSDKIPCADQIEWVKNTTLETKSQYEEYYKKFTENNVDAKSLSTVKEEHEHIEKVIADSLKKYDIDLNKIRAKGVDAKDQWNICRDELKSFSLMNRNLSALAQNIRPKVLELAKSLGLPHDTIDDLDHTLGRIVNFIFIIDMGKNTFRDIHSMVKEAGVKTVDGIKLEDKYKFTEEGVEAIGDLKEKEKIGHVEEPAETFFKSLKGTQALDKAEDPARNEVLWDLTDDNELNNLIDFNNEDIEKSDRELVQRERQQAEELRFAERERLEQERLAQQELERNSISQGEREIAEGKLKYPIVRGV